MKKFVIPVLLLLLFPVLSQASNVRFVQDPNLPNEGRYIYVDGWNIVNGVANITMSMTWDNSWRDDYNWDAVYVFVKCKRRTDMEWQHVYLNDAGHNIYKFQTTAADLAYTFSMAYSPENTKDRSTGIFIHRKNKSSGDSKVSLRLRWPIAANGYTVDEFKNEEIEYQAFAIEMVYIPKGPFVPGDRTSKYAFQRTYRQILPEWDVLTPTTTNQADYDKSVPFRDYSPENAFDRINDTRTDDRYHMWYASTNSEQFVIDFGAGANNAKKILWMGIEGYGAKPTEWQISGRVNTAGGGSNWVPIEILLNTGAWSEKATQSEWMTGSTQSYPVMKAIQLKPQRAYRQYKIDIQTTPDRVAIKNISMATVDLNTKTEDAYIIDGRGDRIVFDAAMGLTEKDVASPQTGSLPEYFPVGYEGFYAMKYEVSQLQYVEFLNKLSFVQQKTRTIGDELDNLEVGDYVYAPSPRKNPVFRNGIVLGERADSRYLFVCNLNKEDRYDSDTDGQFIACNFMSPADMLAYASWAGLRPMSELEYEKMGRRGLNVEKENITYPALGEYAWGTATADPSAGDSFVSGTTGTIEEKLVSANINAGGGNSGPVRNGSFAAGATNQTTSGGGWTGVMELSGNLAEIYYLALPQKANLRETASTISGGSNRSNAIHGRGMLTAEGNMHTNMNAYWLYAVDMNTLPASLILRGGSFGKGLEEARLSDRSGKGYFASVNDKDEHTTFRLGYSVTYHQLTTNQDYYAQSFLTAANGLESKNTTVLDTVCSGVDYQIKGSGLQRTMGGLAATASGTPQYIWYTCAENGAYTTPGSLLNWRVVQGANGQNLDIDGEDLKNHSRTSRMVYYKRRTYTPTQYSETHPVGLRIVNNLAYSKELGDPDGDSYADKITPKNHVNGLLAETAYPATFKWITDEGKVLKNTYNPYTTTTSSYLTLVRDSFPSDGEHTVYCEVKMEDHCSTTLEFPILIDVRPQSATVSSAITLDCGEQFMRDDRDDEIYGIVQIGGQVWMAENLRYTNETIKPYIQYSQVDPSGKYYGALYNWTAGSVVNEAICPAGWRVPSNTDFNELVNNMSNISNDYTENDGMYMPGKKLRSGNYWFADNQTFALYQNRGTNYTENGGMNTGFGAMGGGYNGTTSLSGYTQFITRDNYYYQLYIHDNNFSGAHGYASYYYFPMRCILSSTSLN